MRKITASLFVATIALFSWHFGAGCSSSSSGSSGPDQTCQFAQDDNNCWRKLARTIDDCLSDEGAEHDAGGINFPDPSQKGTLSADATSCTYASGRSVTFAADPRVTTTKDSQPDRDVTVTLGGKTCLHYVLKNNGNNTSITAPGGTLTVDSSGVTCPDGSKVNINPVTLLETCFGATLDGDLPGYQAGYSSSTGSVFLALSGMTKTAYDCDPAGGPPLADAGGD